MLNSSKGMPTVTVVVGLVSTLLIGSAIMGSLQAIKTTSLDPNVDQTQSQLDQVGDKTITISASDSDIARKKMQGAIAWNMLAASDCRVLGTFSGLSRGDQDEGDEDAFESMDAVRVEGKAFKTTPSDLISELSESEGNGYTGNFDDFKPLEESGFDYPCVGTQSAIKQMEDTVKDTSNSALDSFFSGAVKVAGVGIVIGGAASCVATAGAGCAAAVAAGSTMVVTGDAAGDLVSDVIVPGGAGDIGAEPGFDMEGVFSRMEFNVEKTFLMGTDDPNDDPFLALALKVEEPGNTPGFWRGKRFSYLVPAGMSPDTFDKDKYHRIYDPGSNSQLVKNDFWNGEGVDAPGTNQERNKMMFYAFRPRMENVPIVSGERITEDILTSGCENEGCSWDVKRLGNFLEETSYLFCEDASGQIQSNAGHIYSSDEATSQEGAVEDQVYPKVEITDKAAACIPTMTISVPDEVNLYCDAKRLVNGASETIFSRETVDRGDHTVDAVCGTDGTQESANLGGYGRVGYYIAEETISQEGCYADWYDITSDSFIRGGELDTDAPAGVENAVDTGAYTLDKEDYPIVLYQNNKKFWSHNYNTSYSDDDGENEIGWYGNNNRITYETVSVKYNASTVENLTYRVSMRGTSSGRVTDGMLRTVNVNRTIIIEERPESSETIVREVAENPGAHVTYMRQAVLTDQNFSGDVRELVIDRTSEGGIAINGVELTGFEGFPDQIAMTELEVSPVRDAESYNQRYDWSSDSDGDVQDLGATQTDLELRSVQTYSEPRVCKGKRGIWESRGKEVIEGE